MYARITFSCLCGLLRLHVCALLFWTVAQVVNRAHLISRALLPRLFQRHIILFAVWRYSYNHQRDSHPPDSFSKEFLLSFLSLLIKWEPYPGKGILLLLWSVLEMRIRIKRWKEKKEQKKKERGTNKRIMVHEV